MASVSTLYVKIRLSSANIGGDVTEFMRDVKADASASPKVPLQLVVHSLGKHSEVSQALRILGQADDIRYKFRDMIGVLFAWSDDSRSSAT